VNGVQEIHLTIDPSGAGKGFVRMTEPKDDSESPRVRHCSFELESGEIKLFGKLLGIYGFFDIEGFEDTPGAGGKTLSIKLASGREKKLVFVDYRGHEALAAVCRWLLKRAETCKTKAPLKKDPWKPTLAKTLAYRHNRPGGTVRGEPFQTVDPVEGLTEPEREKVLAGLDDVMCEELLHTYVDRVETTYLSAAGTPPKGLVAWLDVNPMVRRTFWLALSPYYDDIAQAMKVLDSLRRDQPDLMAPYRHLAVALAVVRDSPDAVLTSRYFTVWGVEKAQYSPPPSPVAVFRFFTQVTRKDSFVFDIRAMGWPLLVHLADFDLRPSDGAWALKKFADYGAKPGSLYQRVRYDHDKADKGVSKLGSRPYTLQNLLTLGGICGDQAHFCSRVSKSLGIPAMKVSGLSRYGGSGHAFACIFQRKDEAFRLTSTGRYFHDHYYTGEVFDPQTRTLVLDRTLAMMLDGASLSYDRYILSMTLVRIAEKVRSSHPTLSLLLTQKALTLNWFNAPGWKLLMDFVATRHVAAKDGLRWANDMMKYVGRHPDLTLAGFSTFLQCYPKNQVKKRQAFYNQAFRLYRDRPDLQIRLRLQQGRELASEGKPADAARLLLGAAAQHAREGRIVLPLVKAGVAIVTEKKMEKQALPYVRKILKGFPRKRGKKRSRAFAQLRDLVAEVLLMAGR